jgi:quinoprotein glucose dehydrogenase
LPNGIAKKAKMKANRTNQKIVNRSGIIFLLNRLNVSWLIIFVLTFSAFSQQRVKSGEWRSYGGDNASRKYSPLSEINKTNLNKLKIAWSWVVPDAEITKSNQTLARATYFQCTPLMVNGVLYVTTPLSQLAAVDAGSGKTLWVYNPKSYEAGRPTNIGFINRGAAYWTDGKEERVFYPTGDAQLIAIQAKTGQPVAEFGEGGKLDLTQGLERAVSRRSYYVSSAPLVCRDVVIVGSSISDGPINKEAPPGHVRGFDVRTGKMKWIFHTIPCPGEFGNETWEDSSWQYTGNTNVWAPISADDELGYVYLPTSTPTNDFYGGHRLGDNLFAESIVCLNAATGQRVWHFQIVHHGLWDYDLPCAPTLVDITVGGRKIKAVAQATKHGFVFVFDRKTGAPVWPIEERPVPQSTIPGERTARTQPFPTKPPPFERQGVTEDDLIDFTPELRAEALAIFKRFEGGPIFTPPSLKGTIELPGYGGGANWGGAAFDPETGVLYIPSNTAPTMLALGQPDANRSNFRYTRRGVGDFGGPRGLPLIKPPYSRITAIDLNQGKILWQVANGEGLSNHALLKHLHLPPLGSTGRAAPLLTKSLLFVGEGTGRTGSTAGGGGTKFKAYDKATGAVLWQTDLSDQVTGAPMTYRLGGKQYIVVAVGSAPPQLVALSLKP